MKNFTYLIFAVFIICFHNSGIARQNKIMAEHCRTIDSLLNILKTDKRDTTQINTLIILCRKYINNGNYDQAMQYAQQAKEQALKLDFKKGLGESYNIIGDIFWYKGNYVLSYGHYFNAMKIFEKLDDKIAIANCNRNIGWVYLDQKNYEKSIEYFTKSLAANLELNRKEALGDNYCDIGGFYGRQNSFEKALDNHLKSLKIREEIGDKQGMALSYLNIGIINMKQSDYEKALDNQFKSLKISLEIGDKQGIADSEGIIGRIYLKQGKYEEANRYLYQSLILLKEIGYNDGIKDTYSYLADLFEKKGDYKQAYNYHKLYSDIKDTLLNEQSNKQIAEMNTKYDSEKKDKELIQKDAQINKQQSETEKQILQRNAFIIGFILVLVLAFFIFNGYRQKQIANKLLEGKNILIENQKQLVEEKNLKITDSINYAKRIQQSILPSQEQIKSFLPDSFIFFRPKDIVSGDFYWFSEKKDKLIIAVADCTGHGVPGAFMSMIGNTLLNEIINVKNILEPNQILSQLNKGIVQLLHQSEESSTQDDGMDITILSIDKVNFEIDFAGANHFAYLFNDINCETLNGDVFSIGGMFGKAKLNFTNQKVKVGKGSTLYLFTDGFIDQFGGEKNIKYLSVRFMQLLQNIQQNNMELQKENLIAAFDGWKGNNKQLDDVTIIGLRF